MDIEDVLRPRYELKRFEVSGDPNERGYSYGEAYNEKISRFLKECFYDAFTMGKTKDASKEQMLRFAKRYTPYIEDYSPEVYEEMKGIADGSGKTLEEIVLLSLHEERFILGEEELMRHCTAFAVTGPATKNGETYIGQTWDEGYEDFWEGDKPLLLHEIRKTGPDILAYTYPGLLAGAGMNSEGLSITWTSTPRAPFEIGVPTYVIIAEVLRKKTIVEALQVIIKTKRAGSFKFTIADKYGEIYVVEATPAHHHLIYVDDCYGYHGDFESVEIRKEFPPHKRDVPGWIVPANRARKLLNAMYGKLEIDVLKRIFSDSYICVHPIFEEGKWTGTITWAFWVMVPSKCEFWIAHGPPCKNDLRKYMP
jgi:isopenicillin-N N-acyltransferase-like protein